MKYIMLLILLTAKLAALTPDVTTDYLYETDGDELVIYGVPDSAQETQTITRDDILKKNPSSIADILRNECNLTVNANGGSGNFTSVNIRGLSGSRVLVLINGAPANSAQNGDYDFSNIDINTIEKIEVIEGGSDTKYANSGAMGGIINIITKKKMLNGFSLYGTSSTKLYYPDFYFPANSANAEDKRFSNWSDFFDTQHLSTGFQLGNGKTSFDLALTLNRAGNHYIYKDTYNVKRRLTNNEIWDISSRAGIQFQLPQYMQLSASGSFMHADRNISGPVNAHNPGEQIDFHGTAQIAYQADYVGTDKIYTHLITDYSYAYMAWSDSYGTSIHKLQTLYAVNRWGFVITSFFTLTTGADLTLDILDSTETGIIKLINGGTYVSGEFTIPKDIQLIPFIKVVYSSKHPVPIPKWSFKWDVNTLVTIKSNIFRVFRVPAINDLYWPESNYAAGNPDLRYEDGVGADIIVEYHNNRLFTAKSSCYGNYIKDVIQWRSHNGQWTPENTGEALFIGTGHSISTNFSKYIRLNANYDFLLSYILTDDIEITDDKRMPYKPVHTFSFGITCDWQTGTISLSGNYASERYTNTLNAGFIPHVFTLDLDINQSIGDFVVFISLKNALNEFYYLIEDYPMPNGSITAGVRYAIKKTNLQ